MVYKRAPTLRAGGTVEQQEHFPLHLANFSSALLIPIVTTVHLQYQTAGCRAITF
jgi:hypothetical protein